MKHYQKRMIESLNLRTHITVILLGTFAFGFSFGRLLLQQKITSPVLRNLIVFPVSYGFFFILVKIWISRIHQQRENTITSEEDLQEIPVVKKEHSFLSGRGWDFFYWPIDAEGVGLILIFAIVLIGSVYWVLLEGPIVLSDAAFEVALSASLLRATKKMGQGNWKESVLKKTVLPFLIVLVSSTIILALLENHCPGQPTLHLMAKNCWKQTR